MICIDLFGTLRVRNGESALATFEYRRAALLLAKLALTPARALTREELAELLWPGGDPEQTRQRLRQALTTLRKALASVGAEELIEADRVELRLRHDSVQVDALRFDAAVKEALQSDPERAEKLLDEAVELYAGELMAGFLADWLLIERRYYAGRHRQAVLALARLLATRGAYEEALAHLQALANRDTTDEEIAREVMRLNLASGKPAEAMRVYQALQAALQKELGVVPSTTTLEIFREVQASARETVAPSTGAPLFGREALLKKIYSLAGRFILLHGPGGVGKSRISEEIGSQTPGRVWSVALSDVFTAEEARSRISHSLGLETAAPVESILTALEPGGTLILDNLEQLEAPIKELLKQILPRSPRLRVFGTSRHRLGIEPDCEVEVEPLDFKSSVEMFAHYATLSRPSFKLTDANRPAVERICTKVAGLPLAIKIVAARANAFSVQELADELESSPEWTSDDSNSRSLAETVLWSYRLLPSDLQRIFRRLSVVRGGCTFELAKALTDEHNLTSALRELVRRSLLSVQEHGSRIRYSLLEPVREFATTLASKEEQNEAHEKLCRYFLAEFRSYGRHQAKSARGAAMARMQPEIANLQAAIRWAFEAADPDLLLELLARARPSFTFAGRTSESILNLKTALERETGSPKHRLLALVELAWGKVLQGDFTNTRKTLKNAFELSLEVDDPELLSDAFYVAGLLGNARLRLRASRRFFSRSLAIQQRHDLLANQAEVMSLLGMNAIERNQLEEAKSWFIQARNLSEELDYAWQLALALHHLAITDFALGGQDWESYFQAAIEAFRSIGDILGESWVLASTADRLMWAARLDEAQERIEASLKIRREANDFGGILGSLQVYGMIDLRAGNYGQALQHLSEAATLAHQANRTLTIAELLEIVAAVQWKRGEAEKAVFYHSAATAARKGRGTPATARSEQVAAELALIEAAAANHRSAKDRGSLLPLRSVLLELAQDA